MATTYLADEEEVLDGLEFLTMAEAAELGHWEIVREMAETSARQDARAGRVGGRRPAEPLRRRPQGVAELAAEEAREG